jgi:hypothetical protein
VKSLLFVFSLLATAANASSDCSSVDPYPDFEPSYCVSQHSCYVSGRGTYDERHRCCTYDDFLKQMVCDDRYPNHPVTAPNRPACHLRFCDPVGRR